MSGTRYTLEVHPIIPARLARLTELANDLLYSWDRELRGLFFRLDPVLWEASRHNPKVFLRRVAQQRLEEAAEDRVFIEEYNRVLSAYDTYRQAPVKSPCSGLLDEKQDLVAYFCAEFGFHESVQIYSGGLRHSRRRSLQGGERLRHPVRRRSACCTARATSPRRSTARATRSRTYMPTNFNDLPIIAGDATPSGNEIAVQVELPERRVTLKVWSDQGRTHHAVSARQRSPGRTPTPTAASPTSSTAATSTRASSRRSCSASAACARCARSD